MGVAIRSGTEADPPRENPKPAVQEKDIYIPDLHFDTLKVKSRNFY
ncbi:hypothetical protein RWA02_02550 [Sinorhizobium meliloti]|nr:hypothetical protein [Sinorhizobium meliloti]MDW9997801.1 hypothetical protein [Sinorhizobium meliloti]